MSIAHLFVVSATGLDRKKQERHYLLVTRQFFDRYNDGGGLKEALDSADVPRSMVRAGGRAHRRAVLRGFRTARSPVETVPSSSASLSVGVGSQHQGSVCRLFTLTATNSPPADPPVAEEQSSMTSVAVVKLAAPMRSTLTGIPTMLMLLFTSKTLAGLA